MNSFNDLLALHRELDELFFEHQRALMLGRFETALQQLETYEQNLVDHILDEEELLLPIYGERVDAPIGGTVEIFLHEHRKIREYLPLFKAEFTRLFAAPDRERAILFLLDSQTMFKKLLVHHDTRERKFLYPLLDQVTSARERRDLFAKLRIRQNNLKAVDAAHSAI
jgi:hemerythrin-like domain-containing protein